MFCKIEQVADSAEIESIVIRIEKLNAGLAAFWASSAGWAPVAAAGLLSKARLDRQVSLSSTLLKFVGGDKPMTDGDLILAWANLGALLEGTLKTFLSVYYADYGADAAAIKGKDGSVIEPEGLALEKLKVFFNKKQLWSAEEADLAKLIQARRNAIHSFQDKSIGSKAEFHGAVQGYLELLRRIAQELPYPDAQHAPSDT